MKKYRILIIEDEYIPANYIQKVLLEYGHNVIGIATSTQEVLSYIEEKNYPDLILMDIKIKGDLDGIQLAVMFQEQCHVAILYVTAYANEHFLTRAANTHPVGYLVKPIQPQTLLSTISIGMDNFIKNISIDEIMFSVSSSYIPNEHLIINNHKKIPLHNHESQLLNMLLKYKNKFVSYTMLENFVWDDSVVGNSTLRTTIWRLRKKLPDNVEINNLYSSGYMISF